MLTHPNFDPVAISLGPLAIRWYGLMYLAAFGFLWWLGRRRIAQGAAPVTRANLSMASSQPKPLPGSPGAAITSRIWDFPAASTNVTRAGQRAG